MIHPVVRSLIAAAGLVYAGCAVEPAPSASDGTADLQRQAAPAEPSAPASPAELTVADLVSGQVQPQTANCGFECHAGTVDILEVSWQFCLHNCPGGPSNCTPMPPPPCP